MNAIDIRAEAARRVLDALTEAPTKAITTWEGVTEICLDALGDLLPNDAVVVDNGDRRIRRYVTAWQTIEGDPK